MRNLLLTTISIGAIACSAVTANAATRSVYYSSIGQSHLRSDTAQSGYVQLTCDLVVRNVSTTQQNITGVTMSVFAGVPDGAGVVPANYRNQKGIAPITLRYYRFKSRTGTAIEANNTDPSTGAPKTLFPFGSTGAVEYDTLLIRGTASFPYRTTIPYDNGFSPPTSQAVMHHCSGWLNVADVGTTPGAVIAVGTIEVVADSHDANNFVRFGVDKVNGTGGPLAATQGPGSGVYNGVARNAANYNCQVYCAPGGCAGWTGAGDMSYWNHMVAKAYAGEAPTLAQYYCPATGSVTNTYPTTGTAGRCTVNPDDDTGALYSTPTPNYWLQANKDHIDAYTFPQHIESVPFLVNMSKPF